MNNVITSGPVLPFAGTDENWFPVRITAVLGPTTYTFQEVWLTDAGLSIADRLGGNSNTSTDPAYPIDGSTFSVTAAGTAVQCLARRAPGLGGVGWELQSATGSVSVYGGSTSGAYGSLSAAGGLSLSSIPAGQYLVWASGVVQLGPTNPSACTFGIAAWAAGSGAPVLATLNGVKVVSQAIAGISYQDLSVIGCMVLTSTSDLGVLFSSIGVAGVTVSSIACTRVSFI